MEKIFSFLKWLLLKETTQGNHFWSPIFCKKMAFFELSDSLFSMRWLFFLFCFSRREMKWTPCKRNINVAATIENKLVYASGNPSQAFLKRGGVLFQMLQAVEKINCNKREILQGSMLRRSNQDDGCSSPSVLVTSQSVERDGNLFFNKLTPEKC